MSQPCLLDLTRLASRAGLGATGVDRVEAAYLSHMTRADYGLVRTALGHILLDGAGLRAFAQAQASGDWGRVDLLSRWNRRITPAQKRGQSFARRHAIARCRPKRLAKMLSKYINGFDYYNVGHSNLTDAVLSAVKSAGGGVHVLIHDTIPLDLPDMQRDGTVAAFAKRLSAVKAHADRIICSTDAVARDVVRHIGPKPITVAALGVQMPVPGPLGSVKVPESPYFMMVGTIEPRKNHALLLDIWEGWQDAPPLLICGRRGWKNEDVFARLDAGVAGVVEMNALDDGQIATLLGGARALLFPSFAEGFGLPPAEAAALGVTVISADLPACREVLGPHAQYLDPHDRPAWKNAVTLLAQEPHMRGEFSYISPDWATHLKLVFTRG